MTGLLGWMGIFSSIQMNGWKFNPHSSPFPVHPRNPENEMIKDFLSENCWHFFKFPYWEGGSEKLGEKLKFFGNTRGELLFLHKVHKFKYFSPGRTPRPPPCISSYACSSLMAICNAFRIHVNDHHIHVHFVLDEKSESRFVMYQKGLGARFLFQMQASRVPPLNNCSPTPSTSE